MEVTSTYSLNSEIVHPLFQDLIAHSTKFITKKIRDEISKVNEYVMETRPPYGANEGSYVIKKVYPETSTEVLEDLQAVDVVFRNTFRPKCRVVTLKMGENGLLFLKCSCMLRPTRGYPCRHMLFVYKTECTFLASQTKFASLMSYLHPFWMLRNVLLNFQITCAIPNERLTSSAEANEFNNPNRFSINQSENVQLLRDHDTKIHEFKVSNYLLEAIYIYI